MFSQRPPLLSKLSECPPYFLIGGAKRLLGAVGGTFKTFLFDDSCALLNGRPLGLRSNHRRQIKTVV
jgi:hypothetical protein